MLINRQRINRRSFIHLASTSLLVPIVGLVGVQHGCTHEKLLAGPANEPNGSVPWKIRITSDDEPGQPLIVSGTIYQLDGRTPFKGASLWVYQTDAAGNYTTSGGDNRNTRLHGQMRTNAEGRYEFRTIKPGSYPNRRDPAHIHAYVSAPGYPEYWIDEYLFGDDPFVACDSRKRAATQGTFAAVLKTTRGADGVLRAVRDIKIERCSVNCTGQ